MDERCVVCGTNAAVRVGGTSFCGSCGVQQYAATNRAEIKRKPRRATWFAFLSSGFLLKGLLGAVALAAVGGVAGAVLQPAEDPVLTTVASAPTTAAVITTGAATTTELPDTIPFDGYETGVPADDGPTSPDQDVTGFVAAIQSWADCVAEAASAHSGGAFDPTLACGEKASPADFGLGNSENAPGHDEGGPGSSENAPGQDEGGPGNSENAPGRDEGGPGNSEDAPGQIKKDE